MKKALITSIEHRFFAALKTTVIVVFGAYLAGGLNSSAIREVIFASILATLLWFGLYVINEGYDWRLEKLLRVDDELFTGCYLLIGMVLALSLRLNLWMFFIFILMVTSELVYCHPRLRFKRFAWAGPVLSGFIGPTLRFGLGVLLAANPHPNFLMLTGFWLLLLGLHLPLALKSRVFRRRRDRELGYLVISDQMTRRLRLAQFLTPLSFLWLGWALNSAEEARLFPEGTFVSGMMLAIALGAATWRMNDIHDSGLANSAVKIMHDMWKLKFWTAWPEFSSWSAFILASAKIAFPAVPNAAFTISATLLMMLVRLRTYRAN